MKTRISSYPPLGVMDEAPSALDNYSEQAIIEVIKRRAGEKTLLIITHRLTIIKDYYRYHPAY